MTPNLSFHKNCAPLHTIVLLTDLALFTIIVQMSRLVCTTAPTEPAKQVHMYGRAAAARRDPGRTGLEDSLFRFHSAGPYVRPDTLPPGAGVRGVLGEAHHSQQQEHFANFTREVRVDGSELAAATVGRPVLMKQSQLRLCRLRDVPVKHTGTRSSSSRRRRQSSHPGTRRGSRSRRSRGQS